MEVLTLSKNDLERYHKEIPMIKVGHSKVIFDNEKIFYKETEAYEIDMTIEEKVDLWKKIINFDTSLIQAIMIDGQYIAGAITVTHSPKANMLKSDMKNAVLWDIRVHPDYQNLGLASTLLQNSLEFASTKKCSSLLIETQNNNPKAVSFYIKHGATLLETNEDAYPKELNEVQFIFQIKTDFN